MTTNELIEEFLRTGNSDANFNFSCGHNYADAQRVFRTELLDALIAEVRTREVEVKLPEPNAIEGLDELIQARLEPMARGLFPKVDQDIVLELLCRSVVFLTPSNIEAVLRNSRWLSTTWDLACLYLSSIEAEPLSDQAPDIVGLSEGSTCYVSLAYFREGHRFDDFVVHEASHVFHSCKRETVGLPSTRRREWLLEIEFAKREPFAYCIEAYSRIVALGHGREQRWALLAELKAGPIPNDDRVDVDEYLDILNEAVESRNGWKRILRRCSTSPQARK